MNVLSACVCPRHVTYLPSFRHQVMKIYKSMVLKLVTGGWRAGGKEISLDDQCKGQLTLPEKVPRKRI